ncbi:proline-rich nuclear receptor coactivator 2 [Platysternon megacephalum]|uniref:Proline-rich nuclear receptor coactivator 2 n=1 Tax=Platysternon megacephalum TaxID=55544 RepID=A0A4D9F680_9SAUR|nr:proline-rich nuclear receptor coactivator 2 [Platysternon megacephalum]
MAERAGSREPPPAGPALPEAPQKGGEEAELCLEPVSLEIPAVAPGKRRERRSGLAMAGAAERFPGSLGTSAGAAADPEASLLEAAKATPRRSSIIKLMNSPKGDLLLHQRAKFIPNVNSEPLIKALGPNSAVTNSSVSYNTQQRGILSNEIFSPYTIAVLVGTPQLLPSCYFNYWPIAKAASSMLVSEATESI